MSSDIAISPVNLNNKMAGFNKPSYLVCIEASDVKKNHVKKFITIDKPDTGNSFLQMKGVYTEASEEDILSSYQEILTSAKREDIIEIMVPWNRIYSVRNLVFKAK